MSAAAPAKASRSDRAVDSKFVVSDVDLRALRVRGKALELALLVRHEAFRQGTLQPIVSNVRAARELGVTVRTIQRAKRRLEDAGVVLMERKSRHVGENGSEHLAHRYQLDRRALEALHDRRPALRLVAAEGHLGVTGATPPIGSSKPSEEEKPSASPPPPKGRPPRSARDGPPGPRPLGDDDQHTVAVGSALPVDAPHGGPADGPAGTASLTGWRSVLPLHVVEWFANVGVHYADARDAFHAEVARLPRFEPSHVDVERYRRHLLRELGELQLALGEESGAACGLPSDEGEAHDDGSGRARPAD